MSDSPKDILRQEARRHRVMRDPRDEGPDDARDVFFDSIEIDKNQIVAAYWPMDKEFDPLDILNDLAARGSVCALPVVEKDSKVLSFVQWRDGEEMVSGAYDIPQPIVNNETIFVEPDVLLVPLLTFDRRGNRLGQGGGYYDATLASLRSKKEIVAVGVAYASQACLFSLPTEDHDQKLDWVVTPKEAHDFRMHNNSSKE